MGRKFGLKNTPCLRNRIERASAGWGNVRSTSRNRKRHIRIKRHIRRKKIAVDTETTGLNVWTGDRPFMIILWHENNDCDIWEWDVDPWTRQPIIPPEELQEVKDILLDEQHILGFWNAKFDLFMLESIGIVIPFRFEDGIRKVEEVRWMAKCINNLEFSYHLKQLASKYIGIENDDEKELGDSTKAARFIGSKLGWSTATKETHGDKDAWKADYWISRTVYRYISHRSMKRAYPNEKKLKERLDKINPEACFIYGSTDGERTMGLWKFYILGMNDYELWDGYNNEMELLPFTMEMERKGICIDNVRMLQVKKECQQMADEALERLKDASGNSEFNPNSAQQVQKFCYDGEPLNLEILKRTKRTKKGGGGS